MIVYAPNSTCSSGIFLILGFTTRLWTDLTGGVAPLLMVRFSARDAKLVSRSPVSTLAWPAAGGTAAATHAPCHTPTLIGK